MSLNCMTKRVGLHMHQTAFIVLLDPDRTGTGPGLAGSGSGTGPSLAPNPVLLRFFLITKCTRDFNVFSISSAG